MVISQVQEQCTFFDNKQKHFTHWIKEIYNHITWICLFQQRS
jgi:hypothetical protein